MKALPTFKQRVNHFWDWLSDFSDRHQISDDEDITDEVIEEFASYIAEFFPRFAWSLGPSEIGSGSSLTFSGNGDKLTQKLCRYWLEQAKPIEGWEFSAARQPCSPDQIAEMRISVGGEDEIDFSEFQFRLTPNDKDQVFETVVWHPAFEGMPDENRFQILFLMLDEALGEFGTSMWIGEIKLEPIEADQQTVRIEQLGSIIQQWATKSGWDKPEPLDQYTLYELDPVGDFPRGDTLIGISLIPAVIDELIDYEGTLPEDPLEGTGAELVYLRLDRAIFVEGQESEQRGEIEELLDQNLQQVGSGYCLGGAFGVNYVYIDLLLTDGDQSRQIVKASLDQLQIGQHASMMSFL